MELDWLEKIVDVLPDDSNYQKSFFDLTGFPRWETVNSNLLAFYFNKEEEHNLNTLFIESLLMLLSKDTDVNFYDDFEVFREYRTKKGNFIDILIKSNPEESLNIEPESDEEFENNGADWAIIIENKIDANLHNNLTDYWKSVKATNKIGVVLSKEEIELAKHNKGSIFYKNITHKALVEKVQQNLFGYFSKSNEKHLLFLKEYINNIENIYYSNIMDDEFSVIIDKFHEYKTEIIDLKDTETKLIKHISETVFEVFEEYGFKPYSNKATSHSKHFYPNEELQKQFKGFRFWVSMWNVLYNKEFKACFELHNKANTQYGSEVKRILASEAIYNSKVHEGEGGSDKGGYNHIYLIKIPLNISQELDLKEELKKQLKTQFFEHPAKFLDRAQNAFELARKPQN